MGRRRGGGEKGSRRCLQGGKQRQQAVSPTWMAKPPKDFSRTQLTPPCPATISPMRQDHRRESRREVDQMENFRSDARRTVGADRRPHNEPRLPSPPSKLPRLASHRNPSRQHQRRTRPAQAHRPYRPAGARLAGRRLGAPWPAGLATVGRRDVDEPPPRCRRRRCAGEDHRGPKPRSHPLPGRKGPAAAVLGCGSDLAGTSLKRRRGVEDV